VGNYPQLISRDRRGEIIRIKSANNQPDNFAWLNPTHTQTRKFMVDLIAELVSKYAIAGIQLDDHFCFPRELGYDNYTQELFTFTNVEAPPLEHHHPSWIEWGCQQMTEFLEEIHHTIKKHNSQCLISISPNPWGFAKNYYLTDWVDWINLNLVDELVLQVYRDSLIKFMGELNKPEIHQARSKIPLIIGINCGLKTSPVNPNTLKEQVQIIKENSLGVAFFFYESVFYKQLTSPKIPRTIRELHDFL
jgi:uncharacterized lipoprotein YddW (UPF0748 family)